MLADARPAGADGYFHDACAAQPVQCRVVSGTPQQPVDAGIFSGAAWSLMVRPVSGTGLLNHVWDDVAVIAFALIIHHWAALCGVKTAR